MKLLPVPRKRHFCMPDEKSSCCGARTRAISVKGYGMHECVCCGHELHAIGDHPKYAATFVDLEGVFVNDNQYGRRVRSARYTSKYFVGKHGKIVRQETLNSITYNWETGMLYRVVIIKPNNKRVRNITYQTIGLGMEFEDKKEFFIKIIQWRAFYLLPEIDIIRDIEQSLNINDLFGHIDEVFGPSGTRAYMQADKIAKLVQHVMYCLAYPRFAWMRCPVYNAPTVKFRKALKTANSQRELYLAFFNGNIGKGMIKFLNQPNNQTSSVWSATRFLSAFLNKDKIFSLFKSGWINNIVNRDESAGHTEIDDNLDSRTIATFANEYGVGRLLNQIEDSANSDEFKRELNISRTIMWAKDSISMWKDAKEGLENWEVPRCNSLHELHDKMSREISKIEVPNENIRYNEEEEKLNSVFGNVEFCLARDVHNVIDLGGEMHICVGGSGYTKQAVEKKIQLIFGMIDGKPEVCMEIKDGKLVQAKMFQNGLPKNDIPMGSAIKEFCIEHEVDYYKCHDVSDDVEQAIGNVRNMLPAPAVAAPNHAEAAVFVAAENDVNELFPF